MYLHIKKNKTNYDQYGNTTGTKQSSLLLLEIQTQIIPINMTLYR